MEKELSHDALYTFLKTKYGERVGDMLDLGYKGSVFTTLDSKKFTIMYGKSYLLLSTTKESREVIDDLMPSLTEFMKARPICSYNMVYNGDGIDDYFPSIEWETINPNHRLKLIINNNAFSNAKVYNIKLYNGRNIYDYMDNYKIDDEKELLKKR